MKYVLQLVIFISIISTKRINTTKSSLSNEDIHNIETEDAPTDRSRPNNNVQYLTYYSHLLTFQDMTSMDYRGAQFGFIDEMRNNHFADKIIIGPAEFDLKKIINLHSGKDFISYVKNVSAILPPSGSKNIFRSTLYTLFSLEDDLFSKQFDNRRVDKIDTWYWFVSLYISQKLYLGNLQKNLKNITLDEMSALFLYHYCTYIRLSGNNDARCPDPCFAQPCASDPNTESQHCFWNKDHKYGVRNLGLFASDYWCRCRRGYNWIPASKRCLPIDLCTLEDTCSFIGTHLCIYIPWTHEAVCECKEGSMGVRCDQKRNACVERQDRSQMSGDAACNTGQNNTCYPNIGFDSYRCHCTSSWQHNWQYAFPNCLSFTDQCSSTVCRTGDCVSSPDGQISKCICPSDFTGPSCAIKRAMWAPWTPWTTCNPVCGLMRRAVRTRVCDGHLCLGQSRQTKFCEHDYCGLSPMYRKYSPNRWRTVHFLADTLIELNVIIHVAVILMCTFCACLILIHPITRLFINNLNNN